MDHHVASIHRNRKEDRAQFRRRVITNIEEKRKIRVEFCVVECACERDSEKKKTDRKKLRIELDEQRWTRSSINGQQC